jgi:hypothetical protein
MLFICELEGHPKPESDYAIIEANSRDHAFEKALKTYPNNDTVFSYEVPRKQWAKIPTDLIDKCIGKSVAEKLRTDCGIAEDDYWACMPLSLFQQARPVQQDNRWQGAVTVVEGAATVVAGIVVGLGVTAIYWVLLLGLY